MIAEKIELFGCIFIRTIDLFLSAQHVFAQSSLRGLEVDLYSVRSPQTMSRLSAQGQALPYAKQHGGFHVLQHRKGNYNLTNLSIMHYLVL
jgi:hypothetical protein